MQAQDDLKRLQALELQRSEARYRSLVEATALDVWRTDADGKLMVDMPGWREHTQQSADELRKDGWLDALDSSDRERISAAWQHALDTATPFDEEYSIRSPSGERRELWVRGIPVLEDGLVYEWIGITVDITERKDLKRRVDEQVQLERMARQEAERARLELQLIAEVGEMLAAVFEVEQILSRIGEFIVPQFAEWFAIHLLDGQNLRLATLHHPDAETLRKMREFSQEYESDIEAPHGAGAAVRTGKTDYLPSVPDEILETIARDEEHLDLLRSLRITSGVAVPLVARGKIIGALTAARVDMPPFTEGEVALLEQVAYRTALGLDNAMAYERERGVALTLQRSLLPGGLPTLPGASYSVRYLPGSEGAEVGGDWYDVIAVGPECFAFVVGDVMGRGVKAAAVMGQLRSTVRAYSLEGHGPADLLERVDQVTSAFDDSLFATCVYAHLDMKTLGMEVSTAGHLPPVVVSDRGAFTLRTDPCVPLGVGGATFTSSTASLEAGSMVVLYTDGLVERSDRPLEEGLRLLRDAAQAAYDENLGVEAAADHILQALGRSETTDDDVALLVLRVADTAGDLEASNTDSWLVLPPHPSSVGSARRAVKRFLAQRGIRGLADKAELLTSELVTNGLRHAGSDLRLRIAIGERLRVEVHDEEPDSLPTVSRQSDVEQVDDLEEGGRGLLLVRQIADDWGAERESTSKSVWFELDLPGEGSED